MNQPVITNAVEKPISVWHHGCNCSQYSGVAHQTSGKHKTPSSSAVNTKLHKRGYSKLPLQQYTQINTVLGQTS